MFLKVTVLKALFYSVIFLLSGCALMQGRFDVTMVGAYQFAEGIGRRPIGQIRFLKDLLRINFVNTLPMRSSPSDIPPDVLAVLEHSDKTPGTVLFFLDSFYGHTKNPFYGNTDKCKVRIAYVTIESTKAPDSWVDLLNEQFDAVAVPDPWLVETLERSGVLIPIFVLPEICFLEDFLEEPLRLEPHYPFSFGISANNGANKNYDLLLEAFAAEFKNSPEVVLRIHCTYKNNMYRIIDKINALGLDTVIVTNGKLPWLEYKEHMKNIDCYTLLSRGEGFSITPREALALGRPCIMLNHTAHRTLCSTGYVRSIEPSITITHDGECYDGELVGYTYSCDVRSAGKAMRDVYENYDYYREKAAQGREWVKQYLGDQLKAQYLALLKPKVVMLGLSNEVRDGMLITNSHDLCKKYQRYIVPS